MNNQCDACQHKTNNFSILGIMGTQRKEGRRTARVCMSCTDHCPCGDKGTWWDGKLTCSHGYVYQLDYWWNGERAELIFNIQKRKWWSYVKISATTHQNLSLR